MADVAPAMTGPGATVSRAGLIAVGRSTGPLEPSYIAAEDALATRAGNRFDVVGGGVIYCGTNVRACFAETVARFRPSPKMRALMEQEEPGFVTCGGVPQDWRNQRVVSLRTLPTHCLSSISTTRSPTNISTLGWPTNSPT